MTIKQLQYDEWISNLKFTYQYMYLEQPNELNIILLEETTYNSLDGVRLGNIFFNYDYSTETVYAQIIPEIIVFRNIIITDEYSNIDVLTHDSDNIITELSKYCFCMAPNIGISGIENLQCNLDLKIETCKFEQMKITCAIDLSHLCSYHICQNMKNYWNDKLDETQGDVLYSCKNHTHPYIQSSFKILSVNEIEYFINNNINIEGCGLNVTFNPITKTLNISI